MTSLSAVATYYGWSPIPFANFLSAAGVVISVVQGVQQLSQELSLPKYSDYNAADGKYGDVFDTINHNKYCRVVFNVGTSQYIGGILAGGMFNYVKRGYTGIQADSDIISSVQRLFDSCIGLYGYNALYQPA